MHDKMTWHDMTRYYFPSLPSILQVNFPLEVYPLCIDGMLGMRSSKVPFSLLTKD